MGTIVVRVAWLEGQPVSLTNEELKGVTSKICCPEGHLEWSVVSRYTNNPW